MPTSPKFWRNLYALDSTTIDLICAWDCSRRLNSGSYPGIRLEMGFRADLIVEDLVIVEIKSAEAVAPPQKTAFDSPVKHPKVEF